MNIKYKKILMLGIGGIGVSALARLYNNNGALVYGFDKKESALLKKLENEGIKIISEQEAGKNDYDCLVYTNAIPASHHLLLSAVEKGIKVFKRGEILADILSETDSIAVTGSHGKTTTTFMTGNLFSQEGLDPSIYGGGIDLNLKTNFVHGKGKWFIAELDESDRTFIKAKPLITVITNWEHEHVDEYESFENQKKAFIEFMHNSRKNAVFIISGDDENLKELCLNNLGDKKLVCCGKNAGNDIILKDISYDEQGMIAEILTPQGSMTIRTNLFGEHNAYNILFSTGAALEAGIKKEGIEKAFKAFQGVERRFEIIKKLQGNGLVISDYGHHPTEIKTVLKTARQRYKGKKIIAVFEAHRYSRLKKFLDEFVEAFKLADYLIFADIYSAGEKGDTKELLKRIQEGAGNNNSRYIKTEEILNYILSEYKNGEIIILFSAGLLDGIMREKQENV